MSRLPGWIRGRWLGVALVASLLLNGFLTGMFLESFHGHGGPRAERMIGYELRRLGDQLPRDAAAEVAAEVKPLGVRLEPHFAALRAMRDEVNRLAAAPSPDRAAIDARLAAMRAEAGNLQAQVQAGIIDALLKLPPEKRRGLAEPHRD